jgi:hypothetical protein
MLFMMTEQFKNGDPNPVGERFRHHGRMLPASVSYLASWVDPEKGRCFQIMEAPDRVSLDSWIEFWSDLVDFEIVPVLTSGEYWGKGSAGTLMLDQASARGGSLPATFQGNARCDTNRCKVRGGSEEVFLIRSLKEA